MDNFIGTKYAKAIKSINPNWSGTIKGNTEDELVNFLGEKFIVHKVYRSHKHSFKGRARKRRTISVYAEKDYK